MKKFIGLFAVPLAGILLLTGCAGTPGPATGSSPIVIKLSHDLLENTPQHLGALEFERIVEEKTKGALDVQIFAASQLGTDVEVTEMMQTNTVQAGLIPTAKLSGFDPQLQLVDLPFIFPDRETTYKVLDSDLMDDLFKPLEAIGLKGIAFWESGFKQITANQEIRSPKDFLGMKVRVMESPLLIEQYKAVGANPTAIDFAETYNALQQNVVEAQENPLVSIVSMKFYEVQSHLMLSNHGYLAYAFLFSKTFWDTLTPEHQTIIEEAALEAATLEREETAKREETYVKTIADSGTTIVRLTDAEVEEFRKAWRPVHDKFRNIIGAELLKKAYDKVEEYSK